MTSSRAMGRLTACVAAASIVLISGCTSADSSGAAESAPSTPSAKVSPDGPPDDKLIEQAQAALAAAHSGTMVEAGVERVADGIHAEPLLEADRTYRFQLVCVGGGSVRVVFRPENAGRKATVPCDGAVAQQRLTGSEPLRIDVDGGAGATGTVAWQIDTD
ncbi:hypothetical protein [Streptomyces brasiliscabiei]|uniref:hypothetical protein n=1 Tax=Streptomyces brasiliscabiei TaxID=2736302 RepID=UPI001F41987F|nr:hypothetical protein [Streptomyces brasiliscabiei]